jgi:major intracellular serine protease
MQLNYFHKIVLLFAFLVLGVGIFNSVSKRVADNYSQIATIAEKYDLISFEPLSDEPVLLSQAWLKNMMVSSFINLETDPELTSDNQLIVKIDNPSPTENIYLLSFPENKPIENIRRDLIQLDSVSYVEPNYSIQLQVSEPTPTEELVSNKVDNTEVDAKTKILPSVELASEQEQKEPFKVGIIDSGVDKNHPAFKGKKVFTTTFLDDLSDRVGHGTHLAGIIMNSAPDAEIHSYKFTDGKTGKLSGVIRAINQAVKDEVDLVNLSLGLSVNSSALQESIELLRNNNILIVAAAGNQNSKEEFYPAALNGVISVAALTNDGEKLPNSNYGKWVLYSTDGQDVFSLAPEAQFRYLTGTSQSAAVISGLIAKFATQNEITPDSLSEFLSKFAFQKEDDFSGLLGVRIGL